MMDPSFAWILSVGFAVLGAVSLIAALRARGTADRISYGLHVLMSAGMVAMPWAWGMSIPVPLSVAVFTAASLWYAYQALFRPASAAGPGDGHVHHGPVLLWYHAAMMAAMVWMAVLMSIMADLSGMGGDGHSAMAGMSGMSGGAPMAGMTDSAPTAGMSMADTVSLPVWSIALSLAFVLLFAVAAVWYLVRLVRAPSGDPRAHPALPPVFDTLLSFLMAIGMGAGFLLML